MYPKKRTQKLIDKYSQKLIEDLDLSTWKINIYVYKSDAKELKEMKLSKCSRTNNAGISFIGDKSADIILFYNELLNRRDAISTLIHELLHCRMSDLLGLITIKQDKGLKLEEKIVRDIERMAMGIMRK